jgi:hypothetical protein
MDPPSPSDSTELAEVLLRDRPQMNADLRRCGGERNSREKGDREWTRRRTVNHRWIRRSRSRRTIGVIRLSASVSALRCVVKGLCFGLTWRTSIGPDTGLRGVSAGASGLARLAIIPSSGSAYLLMPSAPSFVVLETYRQTTLWAAEYLLRFCTRCDE